MKILKVLAPVLLSAIAWAQNDGNGECLVDGGKAQIIGTLRVVVESSAHPIKITGYVVDLLKPRCYVKRYYPDSNSLIPKQETTTISVETIQIYFNESDLPPELEQLTRDAPDAKVRWARLEKWFNDRLGKSLLVAGSVGSSALSSYAFTDPTIKIDSISICQVTSKADLRGSCQLK